MRARKRRTNTELDRLFLAVEQALRSETVPPTKRRLFYRLVVAGVLEKTEHAYWQLCAHTTNWCRAGRLSWDAFDGELDLRGDDTYEGALADFLVRVAGSARKDLWGSQPVFVVIVCEKAGIANLLLAAVERYRVSVVSAGGFEGDIALFKLGEILSEHGEAGRALHVGYFGDWDPSGVLIDASVEETLRNHHGIKATFERLAVTKRQIRQLRLPTRPTKRGENRHAVNFAGDSVEVDAIPTVVLQRLAEDFVLRHINPDRFNAAVADEEAERARVLTMLGALR